MILHESGQMYLETIFILLQKNDKIRAIDVCNHLNYSKPSVSRAIGLLKKGEFVVVDKDGFITMTDLGKQVAETLYERHTILANLFISLGVDKQTATEDACRIEHVISDKSFSAIKNHFLSNKK